MDSDEENYLEAAERSSKQNYLREEIIEMDYSPYAFQEFMTRKGGADIDLWTFEELQDLVREFRSQNRPLTEEELQAEEAKMLRGHQEEEHVVEQVIQAPAHEEHHTQHEELPKYKAQLEQPKPYMPEKTQHQPIVRQNTDTGRDLSFVRQTTNLFCDTDKDVEQLNVKIEKSRRMGMQARPTPPPPIESFETYQREGNRSPPSVLSIPNGIHIKISSPKISSGGIFSSKELSYTIETNPMGWEVIRKDSDITWLLNTLRNLYPSQFLPPNPPRRFKTPEDSKMPQRLHYIEQILEALLRDELIRRSHYVVGFLSETNDNMFDYLVKQGKKVNRVDSVQDIYTLDGVVKCDPVFMKQTGVNYHEYFTNMDAISHRIKKQLDMLGYRFQQVSEILNELTISFEQLKAQQNYMQYSDLYIDMLESVRNVIEKWGKSEIAKADLIRNKLGAHYKYAYKEAQSFQTLERKREEKDYAFNKFQQRLNYKKDKLWIKADVRKWEMAPQDYDLDISILLGDQEFAFSKMCYNETLQAQALQDESAHYNYQYANEGQRLYLDRMALDCKFYKVMAQILEDNDDRSQQTLWEGLKNYMDDCLRLKLPDREFLDKEQ